MKKIIIAAVLASTLSVYGGPCQNNANVYASNDGTNYNIRLDGAGNWCESAYAGSFIRNVDYQCITNRHGKGGNNESYCKGANGRNVMVVCGSAGGLRGQRAYYRCDGNRTFQDAFYIDPNPVQ